MCQKRPSERCLCSDKLKGVLLVKGTCSLGQGNMFPDHWRVGNAYSNVYSSEYSRVTGLLGLF
jgi:hypothetical protein